MPPRRFGFSIRIENQTSSPIDVFNPNAKNLLRPQPRVLNHDQYILHWLFCDREQLRFGLPVYGHFATYFFHQLDGRCHSNHLLAYTALFSSMYARTEGVRRLRSMYRKTSSSAYRMDPSSFTQAGPTPTLRQYRSVPTGIEVIAETIFVVRSFTWLPSMKCVLLGGFGVFAGGCSCSRDWSARTGPSFPNPSLLRAG